MTKKTPLIALILLPAFFLLHNYNEIFGFIPMKQMILDAIIIYGILALAYFILRRMKITDQKSCLILLIVSALFLFYVPLNNFLRQIVFRNIFKSFWLLTPVFVILVLIAIRKIIKSDQVSPRLNLFLNVVMICLVATELIGVANNLRKLQVTGNLIYSSKSLSDNYVPTKMPDSSKPDIYFLVFDEYTNNKTLEKLWHFDNSAITDWLSGKGFYTPANTRANYSFTVYSVSSTFNMNYIDPVRGSDGTVPKYVLQGAESLNDNETFRILKKENYVIDFLAPFKNSYTSNNLGSFFGYVSAQKIIGQTLAGKLDSSLKFNFTYGKWSGTKDDEIPKGLKQHFALVRNTVDQIKKSVDSNSNRQPHFVYGHILVPHEPHMFDSSGNFLIKKVRENSTSFSTYVPSVKYADSLIREIVEHVTRYNKHNTIIIIEGDHGFRSFFVDENWFVRTPDSLKNYFLPNFYAIYFPDKNYSRLYDHISPVNTFRIVFDQFFMQNFPILKDSGTVVKDTDY
ncbi:MAG TPA: sulfatase-like hydrolase/transferase [Puia sp.]|nr:sulfatase-like hydrolase/transferase [Puia sp.]